MNKTEEWRDIKGYEGIYQVSNLGRVKSLKGWNGKKYISREKILKVSKQEISKTYCRYKVDLIKDGERKNLKVHRLVAEAFIPNPNNYKEVNHKDSNPLNNCVCNLEWCDHKYNIKHSIDEGNQVRRINTIDRDCMLTLLNSGKNYDDISKILGVSKGTVFNYIRKFKIKKIYV